MEISIYIFKKIKKVKLQVIEVVHPEKIPWEIRPRDPRIQYLYLILFSTLSAGVTLWISGSCSLAGVKSSTKWSVPLY